MRKNAAIEKIAARNGVLLLEVVMSPFSRWNKLKPNLAQLNSWSNAGT